MSLPRNIRQDLELIEVAPFEDGSPRWRLHDPVANQYYDIGWLEIEILKELRTNPDPELDSSGLAKIIADRASVICNSAQIEDFLEFLQTNSLLWSEGEVAQHRRQSLRDDGPLAVIKEYLPQIFFIKIPILQPDAFLDRMMPYVNWAFHPATRWAVLLCTLVAFYLTSRQWDYFFSTFVNYMTPIGLVYFGIAVIFAKIMHELGHAFVARRMGISVRSMGVAFLLFWPILYTDTTDAWRLRTRGPRVLIGLAGIMVETGVAAIALLAWNFMPDGVMRTVLFMLATTTWLMTLFVNINPFMRFDGYYIFSDLTGMDNLHERAADMGKWWIREKLFKYGDPPPDPDKPWLVWFAYATWLYRLIIFTAIFWIIYANFFKVLGVMLAVLQISRMLLIPIGKEVIVWWQKRDERNRPRTRFTGAVILVLLVLFATPLDNELSLPAYWQSRQVVTLYSPIAGQVSKLPGDTTADIKAGDTVFVIDSPDLQFELDQAKHDVAASRYELERTGVNAALAQDRLALQANLSGALEKVTDTQAQLKDAHLVADFDATLTDVMPDIFEGAWIARGDKLGTLLDQSSGEIVAYLGESDLQLVHTGAKGVFYPKGGTRPAVEVVLEQIDDFALDALEQNYAASTYGGALDVRDGKDGQLIPQRATYRLLLAADSPPLDREHYGTLVLKSDSRSMLTAFWRQVVGVWRREAGV